MPLSKAKQAEYMRQYRKRLGGVTRTPREKNLKEQVHDLIGLTCAVCGCSHPFALQVDHVGNNGKEERLIYNSLPKQYKHILEVKGEGYQILCANCNIIKYHCHRSHSTLGERDWQRYVARHRRRKPLHVIPKTEPLQSKSETLIEVDNNRVPNLDASGEIIPEYW